MTIEVPARAKAKGWTVRAVGVGEGETADLGGHQQRPALGLAQGVEHPLLDRGHELLLSAIDRAGAPAAPSVELVDAPDDRGAAEQQGDRRGVERRGAD